MAQTKRNGMLKSKLVDAEEKLAACRKSVKEFEMQLDNFMNRAKSQEEDSIKKQELEQQNGLLQVRLNDLFEKNCELRLLVKERDLQIQYLEDCKQRP